MKEKLKKPEKHLQACITPYLLLNNQCTVKIFKAKRVAVHQSNYFGCFIVSSHVGFHEKRIRTVSNYELSSLVQDSYMNMVHTRSLFI